MIRSLVLTAQLAYAQTIFDEIFLHLGSDSGHSEGIEPTQYPQFKVDYD